MSGCFGIYALMNLLTHKGVYVELYSTISVLGYSLLPFALLAMGSLFVKLATPLGIFFSFFIVMWSTTTATRFFENSLDIRD